jgi:hypothetical protein
MTITKTILSAVAIAVALPAAAHAVDCNHAPFAATAARYNELANAMIGAGIKRPAVDKLMNSVCRAKYENSDAQRAALRLLKINDSTIDDPDYDTVALAAQAMTALMPK